MKKEHMHIELSNVYYLLKLDANLILFGVIKKKSCKFCALDSLL